METIESTATQEKLSRPMRALLMMVAAHFCFSIMLSLIKAAQRLQISRSPAGSSAQLFGTWESVLFRCLPMTFVCLFIFFRRRAAGHTHPELSSEDVRWLLTRGLIGALSMACFFYGTLHIPIALASLFSNSSVFMIGLLGHFFLAERLTPTRVSLAVLGLGGVALVLGTSFFPHGHHPTAGNALAVDYLIAFLSGVLASIAYFSVRKMKKIPSNTIILYLSVSGICLALLMGLIYRPLRIPDDPAVLALLCLSGLPAVAAQYLMTWSFQSADAGFVALGQYTGPVFAALLGLVAFDERLTGLQWTGVALTICFGVMMPLIDEQRKRSR